MVFKINIVWWTALSSNYLQNSVGLLTPLLKSVSSSIKSCMGCCLLLTGDPLLLFSSFFCLPYISQSTKRRKILLFYLAHSVFCSPFCWRSPKIPESHLASFQFLAIFPVLFLFRAMEKFLLFGWLVATDCCYDLLNPRSLIN